jgi:branched-chain amino acid aminotransferase
LQYDNALLIEAWAWNSWLLNTFNCRCHLLLLYNFYIDEIICVSQNGEVTEGAVSNFIFLIDGQWVTTPLSAGVLPGVQRAIVIERCGVVVRSLSRNDLDRITSAIVISSLKIALPASSINDRELVIDEGVQSMAAQIRTQTQSHSVG